MRYKEFEKIDTGREGFPALPPDSKPSRARRDGRDLLPKTVLNADPEAHVHTESDVTDLGSYSPIGHGHVEADISDLGTYLTDITLEEIGDLSDVDTTTVAPTDGQALVWSAADSEWQPGTVASGGGGGSGGGALEFIEQVDLTSTGVISLPSGYKGFVIKAIVKLSANDEVHLRAGNGSIDTGSYYYGVRHYYGGSTGQQNVRAGTSAEFMHADDDGTYMHIEIGPDYADATIPTTFHGWSMIDNGSIVLGYTGHARYMPASATAIDRIELIPQGGATFSSPSKAELWGYTDAAGGGTTAPTIVGTATAAGTGSSSSVTIPASTAVGDVMFLFAAGGWTPTVPSKWKALDEKAGTNLGAFTAWKQAVSGDASSSVTVNFSGSFNHRLYLIVFDGETVGDFMFLTSNRDSTNLVNPTQELGGQGYDVLVQCANQRQTTAAITFASGTSHHSDSATQAGALYTITGTGTPVGMSAASASGSPSGASYVAHIAVKPA